MTVVVSSPSAESPLEQIRTTALHPERPAKAGAWLPPCMPGEVEVARILLASATHDVYSVRARRRGGRVHYRIVDEYRLEWKWAPRSAPEPLDQSELAALIDGARVEGTEAGDLTDQLRESQVGVGIRQAACFVTVQSSVYHGLEAYYEWKAAVWLSRRREP